MNNRLTQITKKVGDYFAKKFKDNDNTLFSELSETAIDGFVEEIKKDNPVLAAWVMDWRDKNLKDNNTTPKKGKKICYGSCNDDEWMDSGCGITSSYSGGCGSGYAGC